MRTIPARISCLLIVVALLAFAGIAGAQAIQVEAALSPSEIYVGDSGVLELSITGAADAASMTPPKLPSVPGLVIEYAGITSNAAPVVIINGQRRNMGQDRVVFQYRVTPMATGRFVIPSIPVIIGGRTISTTPLALIAAEPPEARDVRLTLTLDATTVYEGQPVTALLTLAFSTEIESVRFSTNAQAGGLDIYDAPNPAERNADRVIGVDLDNRKVRGALGQTTVGGSPWRTLSMAYTVIPDKAGTLEVPGPLAVMEIKTGEEGFGLFRQSITERRVARATPVSLIVKPLPAEGRPANFSGLVGRFDLSAGAQPTTVHVGEPITVRLSISGSEPLQRAAPPDLGSIPAFASSFKLSPEGWEEADTPANTSPRARVFTTTIRAISDTISEIPAIPLAFFDPAKAEYQTASSRPIPLDVQETRKITAADAIGSTAGANGGMHFPKIERVPIESAPPGAVFTPIPRNLSSQHLLLTEQFRSPLVAAALALPPLGLAAGAIVAIRRRTTDPVRSRRHRALRAALRRLGSTPTPEGAGEALRVFLADRFSVNRATITAHDARRLLASFDQDLAEEAARALLGVDASRFANAPPSHSFNAADIRHLLTRLDEVTSS